MSKHSPKHERAKKTKTYQNIADLARDAAADELAGEELSSELNQQEIVRFLYGMRTASGISQTEMAQRLDCSQGRISKLESGLDDNLSIGDLRTYLRALNHDLMFVICKGKWTIAEQLRFHSCAFGNCFRRLLGLAEKDPSIRSGVSKCLERTFRSLADTILEIVRSLPHAKAKESVPHIVDADDICVEELGDGLYAK